MSETEKQEPTFTESDITKAVRRIASKIVDDYDDLSQLVLAGVMDGAVFLLVDLMRELIRGILGSGDRVLLAVGRRFFGFAQKDGVEWIPDQVGNDERGWLPGRVVFRGKPNGSGVGGGRWRPTAGRFFASLKNDSGAKAGSRRGLQDWNEPQGEGS